MNKLARMIDHSHRDSLGKTGSVAAGDKGDAQAVKAGLDPALAKEVIDAPVLITAEKASNDLAGIREFCKDWRERRVYRHREVFPWICVFALGIAQAHGASSQINVPHRDLAFRESAAGIEADFKAGSHPFRFAAQSGPQSGNLSISQFRLFFLSNPANTELGNRIGFAELASDSLVNQLGEEFDFQQGGIVSDLATVNRIRHAPPQIGAAMRVANLPGIDHSILSQERAEGLPRSLIPALRPCFRAPVLREIGRHPCVESRTVAGRANPFFLNRILVGNTLGFSGIGIIVDSQAGRYLAPFARVDVAAANVPKRGSFMLPQMRHKSQVSYSLTSDKWNNVERLGLSVAEVWRNECENSTVTPRGKSYAWQKPVSLTSGSQISFNDSTLSETGQ